MERSQGENPLSPSTVILSIQIIYEEHFRVREEKYSRRQESEDSEPPEMMPLDNMHQTLSLELPAAAVGQLPEFLRQKEYDGRISVSTCCHECVTVSKQQVLEVLAFHRRTLKGAATSPQSGNAALAAAIRETMCDEGRIYSFTALFILFQMEQCLEALLSLMREQINLKVVFSLLAIGLTVNHLKLKYLLQMKAVCSFGDDPLVEALLRGKYILRILSPQLLQLLDPDSGHKVNVDAALSSWDLGA